MKATHGTHGRPRGWDAADHAAIHRRVQRYARKRDWAEERLRLEDCDGLGDGGNWWWFLPAGAFSPFFVASELREGFRTLGYGARWLFGSIEPEDIALREQQWFDDLLVCLIFFSLWIIGSCGFFGIGSTLRSVLTLIPGLRTLRGESVIVTAERAVEGRRNRHYLTLEREGREPREYRASEESYGDAKPKHAGFAFLGFGRAWDFRHYQVR